METAEYWKECAETWRQQAREYKEQHEKDTSLIASLAVAKIRFKGDGCTCINRPGDEYYCCVHGGEGSWIDLKIKSFGGELKALGQTLYKRT